MLVGLPGGRHQEGPAPTGAEALARFAQESTDSDGDPLAASVVIEVVGSFLAQVVTARGDAHSGVGESEALASVRATAIIHSLGPCLLLFPFQGVVGSGIVEALPRQARRLARWLVDEEFATKREHERFEALAARSNDDCRLHWLLQARLDELFDPLPRAGQIERVVGRFEVTESESYEIGLAVPPSGHHYRVVLPAGLPVSFAVGDAVSMALQRSPVGWIPLASSLPIRPEELDRLFEEALSRRGGAERWPNEDSRRPPPRI
jgi:hypothetical protein